MKSKYVADPGWQYYDIIIDDAHFEWPTIEGESLKNVQHDCLEYLDNFFIDGQYKVRGFNLRQQPTK